MVQLIANCHPENPFYPANLRWLSSSPYHLFFFASSQNVLCVQYKWRKLISTIPIAKRRYYGRVQEAVHEFLLMGPAIVKGDMTDPVVQDFFDVSKTVIVEAKRQDVNGQCTKKDATCKGKEIRDSRYNDMKASMYLLGNAFRINQTKAPDNLPTVQAAKKFFKVMDNMEKRVVKKPSTSDTASQKLYLEALDILDTYLDLVELPPTDSGNYDKEFDTKVGATARIM
eukprot:CAMPEP_0181049242 /NCGR_PEP_ID=MMETSP1070-20121207/15870_1 /TAXON_ID=265543 /ORGANISM="Minutocellus polymorphus, Strain NH13" /LENGTH=226 /DNA_ID=CAMNT_0023128091 /DNA_START=92 /DNA_END=772 /DNA_ORIENTATION=+